MSPNAKSGRAARKSTKTASRTSPKKAPSSSVDLQVVRHPLVFISHDHRDAALAAEFEGLLRGASGGFIHSFRSSDKQGTSGIEFGAEWYRTVMEKLEAATDVVALLTPNSLDRPWILYEAGVAKGKLNANVYGIAIGVPFEQVNRGPFALFQNSDDSEESLTSVVLQLIRRDPDANPDEVAVRRNVRIFRESIAKLQPAQGREDTAEPTEVDANSVAKLFEEMKLMVAGIPERISQVRPEHRDFPVGRRRLKPEEVGPLVAWASEVNIEEFPVAWVTAMMACTNDMPWLEPMIRDVYTRLSSKRKTSILPLALMLRTAINISHDVRRRPRYSAIADRYSLRPMLDHLLDLLEKHVSRIFSSRDVSSWSAVQLG